MWKSRQHAGEPPRDCRDARRREIFATGEETGGRTKIEREREETRLRQRQVQQKREETPGMGEAGLSQRCGESGQRGVGERTRGGRTGDLRTSSLKKGKKRSGRRRL